MLHGLKYSIKLVIAYALFYSGILHIYKRITLHDSAIVLMYHRVLTKEEKAESFAHEGIIVSSETFDMHARILSKYFNVLSIDEFSNCLKGKTRPQPSSCLITFDDGWIDNYTNAFPVLKKHNLPAIIFLATSFIDADKKFWQEKLTLLLHMLYINADKEMLGKYNLATILTQTPDRAISDIKKYVDQIKRDPVNPPEGVIDEITSYFRSKDIAYNTEHNMDKFLTWDQVRKMIDRDIDFGSHTVNHKLLPTLKIEEVSTELKESKNTIEAKTNVEIKYFAYPNGDYTDTTANLVRECGYDVAFTTEHGKVCFTDNPYTLKRINIHNDITKNTPMFYCHILGIF